MVRPKPSAKAKALQLLSQREHSRAELLTKLQRRGYSLEESTEAVDWAQSQHFQSDTRFVGSLFRRRSALYGDRAIRHELKEHGIKSTNLSPSAASVEGDADSEIGPSEHVRILGYLNRKATSQLVSALSSECDNPKEALFTLKAKMFRALQSRGFESRNIESGWKQFIADHTEDA